MAILKGSKATSTRQVSGGLRSTNMNSHTVNQSRGRAYSLQRSLSDARTFSTIVYAQHKDRAGQNWRMLLDTIYGRVHVSDTVLDLGSVVSVQEAEVSVWNAHFEPKQLTQVHVNPSDDLVLEGAEAPEVAGPLEELTYLIRVPAEGDPSINVFIAWVFGAETVTMNVTGSRITFWSFSPTWGGGIRERLEWLTNILAGPLGTEQRRQLRLTPRRSFELKLIAKPEERALMELSCFEWGARRWAIPVWTDVQQLHESIPQGSSFLPCETSLRDFRDGGLVAVRGDTAFDYEIAEVSTVQPDGLALRRPLNYAWRASTRVYPVRIAQFAEQPVFTKLTVNSASVTARFQIVEPCDWPATPPSTTYRGKPVFLLPPEESESLTSSYQRLLEMVDNRIDNPRMGDSAGMAFTAQGHRWLLSGRAQQAEMRSLWYFLAGRQKSLWVPTHNADLQLIATVTTGSLIMTVAYTGYTKFGKSTPGRADIMILLKNGTILFRRIMSSMEEGNSELLTLDRSLELPNNLLPTQVERISFMALSRMDQDFIEITHETDSDGVAAANTVWRSLRDDLGDV